MNEHLKLLKTRATIRAFSDQPVSDDHLAALLESVQVTQSWANTQCWEVVVIKDQQIKDALASAYPNQNRARLSTVDAPVVLALTAIKNKSGLIMGDEPTPLKEWFMFDTGLAAANLTNTAHSLGLGSVIAGWFDYSEASKVLNIPDDRQLVALIPVGHPAEKGHSPRRKEIGDFTYENTY